MARVAVTGGLRMPAESLASALSRSVALLSCSCAVGTAGPVQHAHDFV